MPSDLGETLSCRAESLTVTCHTVYTPAPSGSGQSCFLSCLRKWNGLFPSGLRVKHSHEGCSPGARSDRHTADLKGPHNLLTSVWNPCGRLVVSRWWICWCPCAAQRSSLPGKLSFLSHILLWWTPRTLRPWPSTQGYVYKHSLYLAAFTLMVEQQFPLPHEVLLVGPKNS